MHRLYNYTGKKVKYSIFTSPLDFSHLSIHFLCFETSVLPTLSQLFCFLVVKHATHYLHIPQEGVGRCGVW